MAKKQTMQDLKSIALDETKPKAERVQAAEKIKDKLLNPLPKKDFKPETYEPDAENALVKLIPRTRKDPPKRLPTLGLKPKETMEGQRVGMFENKQDLYLLIAWLSNRVTDLEEEITIIKGGQ